MLDEWSVDTYGHIMTGVRLDRGALDQVWEEIPRHLRREPRLTLTRAQALVACGATEDAEVEIRRTLKEDWSEALINLYGELPMADPAAHLKRIEAMLKDRPEDPALLLAAGRACVRHQLWGKARSYLEASLAIRPAPDTYRALGQLMARVGEAQSASKAFERGLAMTAAAAPPAPVAAPKANLPVAAAGAALAATTPQELSAPGRS
jgi:HemY protein